MAGAADYRPPQATLAKTGGGRGNPLLWALALAGSAVLLHVLLWGPQAPLGRAPVAGAALAVAGLGWALWALRLWSSSGAARLLDEGPFRLGRNPMYLGTAAVLVGAALAVGVPLLAVAAAAYVTAVQRLLIPHEEAALRRAFGGWYVDYRASVPRWL